MELADVLDDLHGAVAENDDRVIIITGATGSTKSTLAYHIGRLYNKRKGRDFSREYMKRDTDSFMALLVAHGPGFLAVLDESTKGALSVETMHEPNRNFRKYLMECRKRRQILIILATHIDDIDSYIRNKRARYWFLVHDRGFAVCHTQMRRDYPGTKASWMARFAVRYKKIDSDDWDSYETEAIEDAEAYGKAALGLFFPKEADIKRLETIVTAVLRGEGIIEDRRPGSARPRSRKS